MKQQLKRTILTGIMSCSLGLIAGCTSLGSEEKTTTAPTETTVIAAASVCTPENPTACIVYEEPDLTIAQSYAGYADMAVSTNAAYQMGSEPVALSTPSAAGGLSVKDKIAQRELAQQQRDLALKPVENGQIVCSGESCNNQLFKTEIEKAVHTTVTEEGIMVNGVMVQSADSSEAIDGRTPENSLKSRIAFGEDIHDWEANQGDTLRSLLLEWGKLSGWTVVWKLDRDYQLEAGVVFRGTFTEVAAAFIRSFARATPAPIGTFYKGNRVLVINAQENENAD